MVWALWRTFDATDLGDALLERLVSGLLAEALVHGMLLSDCEWRGDSKQELQLQVAIGQGLPASALRRLWLKGQVDTLPMLIVFESLYHMYQKLSKCVDYIIAGAQPGCGSTAILARIESFGQDLGQWLKVAGGDKALVTEDALWCRGPDTNEVSVEFGAFVGYSGIRFARCVLAATSWIAMQQGTPLHRDRSGLAGISLEVDPVHASVARHFIDLAGLTLAAEVWLGLLQDTMSLVNERAGSCSEAFSFMDQRGTTFHDDLANLERLVLLPPWAAVTADNVNKPGAPVFLWHLTRTKSFSTALWSMYEFASEDRKSVV